MVLTINEKRFLHTFLISSNIGATKNGGLHRLALSKEDKEIRDTLKNWMKEAGLKVRIDDLGNMYGRREGKLTDAPAVVFGSHLDTQPTGGKFDGILGVLGALEVIRVLNDQKIVTEYPLEIINFTNEEGARFRPPMLGSGGLAGVFNKEEIYDITDNDGVSYKDALEGIGYKGEEKNRLAKIKNYVELHIEQGPVLEDKGKDIGIVGGIQGMSWLNIEINGQTNHAGPTPMENRRDTLVAASEMIVLANKLTNKFEGLRTTVGMINNTPNVVNVIPRKTTFKLDIRHPEDSVLKRAIIHYQQAIKQIATGYQVAVKITEDWNSSATHFDEGILNTIRKSSEAHGYSTYNIFSGPGHDAKHMNLITKTGMIFVKSIDGISHNEKELTLNEDLIKGTNVLLSVILELANRI